MVDLPRSTLLVLSIALTLVIGQLSVLLSLEMNVCLEPNTECSDVCPTSSEPVCRTMYRFFSRELPLRINAVA